MNVKEADIVIIGGGIIGCSIALRLAEKGLNVILLEKGLVGEEASGRNGGGVRQQNRHPAELPLAMASVKMWRTMKEELDWDVGYRVNGNLRLVTSEEEYDTFHKNPDWERELGLDVHFISPEETRSLAPTLSDNIELLGATYCPSDGTVNPLLVVKAIARTAGRIGVEIKEHAPLTGLKIEGDRVVSALTDACEYRAQTFVNSAGPWARTISNWIGLDFPVDLKRSQILVTEAVPRIIDQFISFDVGYLRQTIEGNIHLGVRSQPLETFDRRTTLQAFKDLGKRLPKLFPVLRQLNIIRAFAGLTHWTADMIPVLDKAPNLNNFFMAAGFSGHGFCTGPIVGKLMAEWIADGKSSMDLSAFKWTRFKEIYQQNNPSDKLIP